MKKIFSLISTFALAFAALAHPVYNTKPAIIGFRDVQTVWSAETPTPGNGTTAASQQVALAWAYDNTTPFSVDGQFSGAPGSFEVDVQVAAVDADTNYQTCSNCNVTTVDTTNNTFHVDCSSVHARFARLLMRSRTNSVTITATITR